MPLRKVAQLRDVAQRIGVDAARTGGCLLQRAANGRRRELAIERAARPRQRAGAHGVDEVAESQEEQRDQRRA